MAKYKLPTEIQSAQLEAVFNSVGEGVIVTDQNGHIVRINPMALDLLGYKRSDLLGEWFPKKITALNEKSEVIEPLERPITKAFLTGKPVYEHLYYKTKDERKLPVFISVSPIMLNNKPTGAIEVFRDISVEEAIDRMKSEFISLASHQLRTPLSSIKTYSHMLLDGYMGKVSAEQLPALEIIVAAANRMNELISTLLNISRLESGSVVIDQKLIDIKVIAREVMKDMSIPAKNRAIDIELYSVGDKPTELFSDGPIVKEILTNLVSNSIKYSSERSIVKLIIKGNEHSVVFRVEDSGMGIPKLARDQIFSKFFRAPNVIQTETNGTGLGLYLVKGLIDELGGTIKFTSREGHGTTFSVSLPKNLKRA